MVCRGGLRQNIQPCSQYINGPKKIACFWPILNQSLKKPTFFEADDRISGPWKGTWTEDISGNGVSKWAWRVNKEIKNCKLSVETKYSAYMPSAVIQRCWWWCRELVISSFIYVENDEFVRAREGGGWSVDGLRPLKKIKVDCRRPLTTRSYNYRIRQKA